MRHAAEWWAERVAEVGPGGDVRGVARRHGVTERTLRWWRSELRRRSRKGPRTRLLPVMVEAPLTDSGHGSAEILIEIGMTKITLRGAVSVEQLAAIVTAVTRAC